MLPLGRVEGEAAMVLVNEAAGYRVCLTCHSVLSNGDDEDTWLAVHLGPHGCGEDGPKTRSTA